MVTSKSVHRLEIIDNNETGYSALKWLKNV